MRRLMYQGRQIHGRAGGKPNRIAERVGPAAHRNVGVGKAYFVEIDRVPEDALQDGPFVGVKGPSIGGEDSLVLGEEEFEGGKPYTRGVAHNAPPCAIVGLPKIDGQGAFCASSPITPAPASRVAEWVIISIVALPEWIEPMAATL